jgi:hypothetical protein
MKSILLLIAVGFLFIGCATQQHASERWEYKVASPGPGGTSFEEKFLNDAGQDGWVLVQRDERGRYIFKRPKK